MALPDLSCSREKISVDQTLASCGLSEDPEDSLFRTKYFSGRLSDIAKQQTSLLRIIDRTVAAREKHKCVLEELKDVKTHLSTPVWNHLAEQESRQLRQLQARLNTLKERMIGIVKQRKVLVDLEAELWDESQCGK
ncbi:hypothetical protein MMC27_005249 [Xylographa pallens]|nr:hypothetical protein [Xylographa pallens]